MKLLAVALSALFSFSAFANYCSDWTEQRGISCVFNGRSAKVYARQCENPCWMGRNGQGHWGPSCDLERICSPIEPSNFGGVCSDWFENSSVTCHNPNSNSWERQWNRVCTVGLKTTWCSDKYPQINN